MGTNYYWLTNDEDYEVCHGCYGPGKKKLHIGKSSGGWRFSLHVMDWEGLNSLADWKEMMTKSTGKIFTEYGDEITLDEMLEVITTRSWPREEGAEADWDHYVKEQRKYDEHGNTMHCVDGTHCVGNGEGTWDLVAGEFC